MNKQSPYLVLAYYKFTPIENPIEEVKKHKNFFKEKEITSRIYISHEGINGQMSGTSEAANAYMEWMHSRPEFSDLCFKIHEWHEQAFPHQTVKYRKNLVARDERVNLSLQGDHLSPKEWKEMLEGEEDYLLLDVRNDYEWEIGHFEGAELPPCTTFREFEKYADKLKEGNVSKKLPVMMYCTGGIRCELYSSILLEKGFEKVYQLNGGIINYGLKEGSKHWLGKLFVFDDRLSVPISEEETKVIGKCHRCEMPSDTYYNCANMECNTLFLCCKACLDEFLGCCQETCKNGERIRPYHAESAHKPFRRKHHYLKQ